MKTKMYLSLILVLSAFLLLSACTTNRTGTNTNTDKPANGGVMSCTDTGDDLYSKGSVQDKTGKTFYDNCVDGRTLKEVSCDADGNAKFVSLTCNTGEECKDGVCIKTTTNEVVETTVAGCTDSDGGIKQDVKGYVVDKTGAKYEDSCLNTKTVSEANCNEAGYKEYSYVDCITGYACQDAHCVKSDTQTSSLCKDTDGGLMQNTKGTVTDKSGKTYTDECLNSKQLKEYRCGSADYAANSYIDCANGCVAGACVQ